MSKARERYQTRSISELEKGEKIKHPIHGVLVFIEQVGPFGVFKDSDDNEINIMEVGTRFKKV